MGKERKIRVQVSLDPAIYAIVQELAAAVGASMSSILGELIQDVAPSLQNVVAAVKKAKLKPAEAFDDMAEILSQAQFGAAQAQLDIVVEKKKLRRGPKKK